MSIDGLYADEPPYPSFVIGMITNVNVERHTIDVQPYRMVDPIVSIPLFRSPGDLSLPNKEDIAIIIFDDRCGPACIGVYPKFIKEGTDQFKDFKAAEGDVIHQNSVRGGRTVMTDKGIIKVFNRTNQGYEIDEEAGATFERTPTKKGMFGTILGGLFTAVLERSGAIKRKSVIPSITSSADSQESLLHSNGGVISSIIVGEELYEKKTKITSAVGFPISEEIVGSAVLVENSGDALGVYTPEYSQASAVPPNTIKLRKQTHHYNDAGGLIYTEEVDVLGNTYLKVYGGLDVISQTGDVTIAATLGETNITSATDINIESTTGGANINAVSVTIEASTGIITIGGNLAQVNLGSAMALCNNLPNCLFTGASHTTTNTTVFV